MLESLFNKVSVLLTTAFIRLAPRGGRLEVKKHVIASS